MGTALWTILKQSAVAGHAEQFTTPVHNLLSHCGWYHEGLSTDLQQSRLPAHLHRELHGLSHSTTCSCTCHMPSTSSISTSRTTWTQPFDHLLMHMPHAVDFQHIYIENYMDSAIRPLAHAYATCRMFRDAQVRLAVSGRFTLSVKYTSLI